MRISDWSSDVYSSDLMVEGRIFWDAALPGVSLPARAALFDAMNATIADLHSIDHVDAGLAAYGRPGNYLDRPIARWYRHSLLYATAVRSHYMDKMGAIPEDRA